MKKEEKRVITEEELHSFPNTKEALLNKYPLTKDEERLLIEMMIADDRKKERRIAYILAFAGIILALLARFL